MRRASDLVWPWLVMGFEPPEESMRMSDQISPVWIFTEATLLTAMLSSSAPMRRGLMRETCCGVI